VQEPFPGHQFRIRCCNLHVCSVRGLEEAYRGSVPYARDGLLFAHQDSPYVMEGNPFALQWKDEHCSRWAVDAAKEGEASAVQEVVWRL
jgi:snurportin-1